MRPIQSLWIGNKLSTIEILCINSFLKNGHEFHLYTYEKVKNIPEGTKVFDANEIVHYEDTYEIKNGFGMGSKAPFSDYFRLNLLFKRGGWWVDMDVICLKNFNSLPQEIVATSLEIPEGDCININVLSFPKEHPFIAKCIDEWKKINMNNMYYAIGVDIVKKVGNDKKDNFLTKHSFFNPISYRLCKYTFTTPLFLIPIINFRRRILQQELIELPTKDSYALHIWNEALKDFGVDKENPSIFSLVSVLKKKYI